MIEVELKARLRDRAAAEGKVAAFARFVGEFDKTDSYWHGPDWRLQRGKKGFRLRAETEASSGNGRDVEPVRCFVTFKTKRNEGGIEINRESEFEVSDPAAFVELAERLGCEPFYMKRKRGLKFKVDAPPQDAARAARGVATGSGATIEIVDVEGLGDFIEIELLLEDEEPAALASAQGEIRELLAKAGVSENDIESRFYSELLMAAGLVTAP